MMYRVMQDPVVTCFLASPTILFSRPFSEFLWYDLGCGTCSFISAHIAFSLSESAQLSSFWRGLSNPVSQKEFLLFCFPLVLCANLRWSIIPLNYFCLCFMTASVCLDCKNIQRVNGFLFTFFFLLVSQSGRWLMRYNNLCWGVTNQLRSWIWSSWKWVE